MPGSDALLTLGVLGTLLVALALELYSVDLLMMVALVAIVVTGVIDLDTALQGFANSTLVALGSLYVVAAGLREAGALDFASRHLLGGQRSIRQALARMVPAVTVSSAFLNNTPIVAMGIPAVRAWARRHRFSPSMFLMPLSFAAILGGICTLIGTSTNLVTHGLLQSHGMPGLGFFELAWVGVPCAVAGWAYLVFVAPLLLPEREEVWAAEERERGTVVEMEVERGSALAGRTVEESALGTLGGHNLARLQRGEASYGPVEPKRELEEGDLLSYERAGGDGGTAAEQFTLFTHPGLRFVSTRREGEDEERELHEVVVREGSPLVGAPLEELEIPERFGAVVTGVRRGGERLQKPLGEIKLRPGDILMLETRTGFREAFEGRPEFFVTSEVGGEPRPEVVEEVAAEEEVEEEEETPSVLLAAGILSAVVVLTASGALHIALAGTLGAFAMVVFGFLTPGRAREAVDWSVLVVIGAALGLGQAMEASGAAGWVGDGIVTVAADHGSVAVLAGLYLATIVVTEVVTNNGAAAILFPVALSLAQSQGIDPRPLVIGITVAASTSMLTPIGYQTNLMVYGPGNYRFFDFARVGGGLQALVAVMAVIVIPLVWPL